MKKDPLKRVAGFDWDSSNISHIGMHNVAIEEAEDLFFDYWEDAKKQDSLSNIYKKRK